MKFKILAASILAIPLSACSGEPTETDIANAISSGQDASSKQALAFAGDNQMTRDMLKKMQPVVSDVRKLGCKSEGSNGYLCNVEFKVSGGIMSQNPQTTAAPIRLVKGSDGWLITN